MYVSAGDGHRGEAGPLEHPKDYCTKFIVITTVVIAIITTMTGMFALFASTGGLPPGLNAFHSLSSVGEITSYYILGGGVILFGLGLGAWICHARYTTSKN